MAPVSRARAAHILAAGTPLVPHRKDGEHQAIRSAVQTGDLRSRGRSHYGGLYTMLAVVSYLESPSMNSAAMHEDARFATPTDLNAMRQAGVIGPDGRYLHLGYAFGERLSLMNPVNVEVLALPATGKTARFVIPGILGSDRCCFAVHDPKRELWETCSRWSAHVGQAYRLAWDALDDCPAGVRHASFNFISSLFVPADGPGREKFVEHLARGLIADDTSGRDSYFVERAQRVLGALIQYLIARIDDDSHDPHRYADLAPAWHGREASLPMLAPNARGCSKGFARHFRCLPAKRLRNARRAPISRPRNSRDS